MQTNGVGNGGLQPRQDASAVRSAALSVDEHARRFLSALALILMPAAVVVGMLVLPRWLLPSAPLHTFTFQAGIWVFCSTAVVFWLNRRGHYRWAAPLFVLELLVAPVWASFDSPEMLVFMFVGVLVAIALLPLRAAIAAGALALAGHSLALLHPARSLVDIAFPLSVNTIQIALVLVVRSAHGRLERARLAALAESERWFATTLNSIGDAVLTTDTRGHVSFMNPIAAELTGWSASDARGKLVEDVYRIESEVTGARAESPVHKVLRDGKVVALTNHTVLLSRGGERHPIADSGAPIQGNAGLEGVVLVFRDLSRQLAIEERLERAARLESLGRLAGGVAHDFNNLLTVIGGGLDLSLEQLPKADPLRRDLEDVLEATDRAVALTRQLLAFSRRQVLQPRVVELNLVIYGMERLLRRMLGERITLSIELSAEPDRVLADAVQLEQVVMNLAINAADAMPSGGQLTLSTDLMQATAEEHAPLPAGDYVRLRVSDTGTGMDKLTLERAFEPFFSTKAPGRGTGLGLATVHGIVQQSGGTVLVASQLGKGTTFTVLLPSTQRRDELRSSRPPRPSSPATSSVHTILVVEDDPAVRRLAERVLLSLGYKTLTAASGDEALALRATHAGKVQLLLTDIVMPNMTGPELAHALRERDPALPVVFMSGYADEVVAREGMQADDGSFLAKPFTHSSLAAKVKAALESSN